MSTRRKVSQSILQGQLENMTINIIKQNRIYFFYCFKASEEIKLDFLLSSDQSYVVQYGELDI